MNELIAGIYGTGGFEKVASAEGYEGPETLSDLALMIISEDIDESDEVEKIASVHEPVLEHLVSYDRAGRALAHNEFAELEKSASEGDYGPLQEFFGEYAEENEISEREELRQAILEELARRNA